ncbi:MAG: hypothetical protein LBB21_04425 [Holosporaceae bacterium]|jgi:Mg/Co/Ni transporter MgtE|nr:hypothetical protein [Holosporaceae bacterium]
MKEIIYFGAFLLAGAVSAMSARMDARQSEFFELDSCVQRVSFRCMSAEDRQHFFRCLSNSDRRDLFRLLSIDQQKDLLCFYLSRFLGCPHALDTVMAVMLFESLSNEGKVALSRRLPAPLYSAIFRYSNLGSKRALIADADQACRRRLFWMSSLEEQKALFAEQDDNNKFALLGEFRNSDRNKWLLFFSYARVDDQVYLFTQSNMQDKFDLFDLLQHDARCNLFNHLEWNDQIALFARLDMPDKLYLFSRLTLDVKFDFFKRLESEDQLNLFTGLDIDTQLKYFGLMKSDAQIKFFDGLSMNSNQMDSFKHLNLDAQLSSFGELSRNRMNFFEHLNLDAQLNLFNSLIKDVQMDSLILFAKMKVENQLKYFAELSAERQVVLFAKLEPDNRWNLFNRFHRYNPDLFNKLSSREQMRFFNKLSIHQQINISYRLTSENKMAFFAKLDAYDRYSSFLYKLGIHNQKDDQLTIFCKLRSDCRVHLFDTLCYDNMVKYFNQLSWMSKKSFFAKLGVDGRKHLILSLREHGCDYSVYFGMLSRGEQHNILVGCMGYWNVDLFRGLKPKEQKASFDRLDENEQSALYKQLNHV